MTLITQEVLDQLKKENEYAHNKWGDTFDDRNTLNDWITYATMYASDAGRMDLRGDTEAQYAFFLKAAGLALCAAQRLRDGTLAPRHYDPKSDVEPELVGHGQGREYLAS